MYLLDLLGSQAGALRATTVLAALASILTSAELLAVKREFQHGGLVDSRVLVHGRPLFGRFRPRMSWLVPVASTQLCVSVAVLLSWNQPSLQRLLVVLFPLGLVLQCLLLPYGRDGSDEMAVVVSIPLAGAYVLGGEPEAQTYAVSFIALQLMLCYSASGIAKLGGASWRTGSAVADVLRTRTWGSSTLSVFLDSHPLLTSMLSWTVVLAEICFPIGIFAGGKLGLSMLAMGASFHIIVALVMGLNRFAFWFLAAYPSAYFVMISWRDWMETHIVYR